MAEKKEKQWAVLTMSVLLDLPQVDHVSRIVWFDSRSEARKFVMSKRRRPYIEYRIMPMTRGPRA